MKSVYLRIVKRCKSGYADLGDNENEGVSVAEQEIVCVAPRNTDHVSN